MEKCGRCKERFARRDLIQWLGDDDILSPKFCEDCYNYLVDNWHEGDDVETME